MGHPPSVEFLRLSVNRERRMSAIQNLRRFAPGMNFDIASGEIRIFCAGQPRAAYVTGRQITSSPRNVCACFAKRIFLGRNTICRQTFAIAEINENCSP